MTVLKEKLAGLSGGRILDVATEGGWFIDKLKDAFKEIDEVIGVDIADEDFDEARERLKDDPVSLVVMDGANLEFADESFDTVAMASGMHHLDDIPAVLSEMMRVLKPDGTFVLREMYRDGLNEKQMTDVLQHDWYAKIDRLLGKPHYPTLTKQEIADYAKGLGFSRYDTYEHLCEDCPRSKGETTEEEITEMDEHVAKVKELPRYDELKAERDAIVNRLKAVGISCPAALDIVGFK
jgi:ubiquinone/menaquinone biosynthesis C-methylase UbiE